MDELLNNVVATEPVEPVPAATLPFHVRPFGPALALVLAQPGGIKKQTKSLPPNDTSNIAPMNPLDDFQIEIAVSTLGAGHVGQIFFSGPVQK